MKHIVTLEEFLRRLEKVHGNKIIYIGGYVNMHTKCFFKCATCNNVWQALPANLVNGHGCPACARRYVMSCHILSLEEVVERVEEIHNHNIEYVSGFVNTNIKCKWRCRVCGHEWEATPHNILQGHGCKHCANKNRGLLHRTELDILIEKVRIKTNGMIEYVSGFTLMHKKCKWMCVNCGHIFERTPDHLLNQSPSCPLCVMRSMENPVIKLLNKKKIEYTHNKWLRDCKPEFCKYPLRPDFLIERNDIKLWIECDGIAHFISKYDAEEFMQLKQRDNYKNEYAKEHGYILIRVTSSPTHEWGTERHITLKELLDLIEKYITEDGVVDIEAFRPYDFNRD